MTKFNFIHQHASNLLSRYYGIPAVLIKTQYMCFYKISHSAKMLTENNSADGRGRGGIMGRPLKTCNSVIRALTEIITVLIERPAQFNLHWHLHLETCPSVLSASEVQAHPPPTGMGPYRDSFPTENRLIEIPNLTWALT